MTLLEFVKYMQELAEDNPNIGDYQISLQLPRTNHIREYIITEFMEDISIRHKDKIIIFF